jgi:hypothetical protein
MKHYSHIIRFAIILILVGICFLLVRSFLVPDSFGIYGTYKYGFHRGDSDREQAAQPAFYRGADKCVQCHADQKNNITAGGHKDVTCEACHGVWQAHNSQTKSVVTKDISSEACLLCHEKLDARPKEFPQIEGLKKHMLEQEQDFEDGMACGDCHDPHEPM